MAIKSAKDRQHCKQVIDIAGPEGNAFVLLGKARYLAKQLGKDGEKITEEMTSGEYEHLLEVFDREFGDYIDLQR